MSKTLLRDLNRRFDHTALQPQADDSIIRKLCDEALKYYFYSVVVNPTWVRSTVLLLEGSDIKVCSVAGFPLGANRTDIKVKEAAEAVRDGAHEIDMVSNIGWLVSDRFSEVEREIRDVRNALPYNITLKVIIEAGELTELQQVAATQAVVNGGAQFVKTGTGFFGGATVEQVGILHHASQGQIEVKAAGGIQTLDQCQQLLEAGATRLGSSSTVRIMEELKAREGPKA